MLIDLNFLPLEVSNFRIPVFRSKYRSEEKQEGSFIAQLPELEKDTRGSVYKKYRIGLTYYPGSSAYSFHAQENPRLMVSIIWYHMKKWIEALIRDGKIKAQIVDRFDKYISFVVEDFPEGQRVIRAYPYYLQTTEQFGILLNFAFNKNNEVAFSRKVQQLSFSLDRAGRSNANSYLDRMSYIQNFLLNNIPTLSSLLICGNLYNFSPNLVRLPSQELDSRSYIFGEGYESHDKIKGIKAHPFSPPSRDPFFVFVGSITFPVGLDKATSISSI